VVGFVLGRGNLAERSEIGVAHDVIVQKLHPGNFPRGIEAITTHRGTEALRNHLESVLGDSVPPCVVITNTNGHPVKAALVRCRPRCASISAAGTWRR
jgi:hypothetical protein